MRRPRTLPAFTAEELAEAHRLLAARVAYMMGRKLEEADWADVYCRVKNIPNRGWSNLQIDVLHAGLGVEHKMLCRPSDRPIREWCGTRLMHPAATRSIRIPPSNDADEAMASVLSQYRDLILARREAVKRSCPEREPDLRTGWLLWQESLREFLYFEEEMLPPDPADYVAEWRDSGGGSRKSSRNLWIFERETGVKRYSVTTTAGAKIQPYFDVPPAGDPALHVFTVQGEGLQDGLVRLWLTIHTARELESLVAPLAPEGLQALVARALPEGAERRQVPADVDRNDVREVRLLPQTYEALRSRLGGAVSDEHRIRLLLEVVREARE